VLAGFQTVDITPPLGVHLAGHFNARPSNEIHDPLTAYAMVLDDGNTRVALVGTDLVGLPTALATPARALVSQQTGIEQQAVMLWATHTHAGPGLGDLGWYPKAPDYNVLLPKLLAGCVAGAMGRMQETTARLAFGSERRISFNRNYRRLGGDTATNPGVGNPAVSASNGPIDPDVGVLLLDQEGSSRAALVNFACHLDVIGSGNYQYSADFPYYMRRMLGEVYGTDFVSLFANGPCGNLNHINVFGSKRQGGYDHARMMGRTLAGEVLKADYCARPVKLEPLWYRSEMVELELRQFSDQEIAQFRKDLEATEATAAQMSSANFARGRALRALKIVESGITSEQVEVQVLGLGDLAIVGIPGEYFVEFGLQLKQQSPAPATFVIELANGSIGYIPTAAALAEGGYEGSSARFSPEAGQKLADAALEMLADHKQAVRGEKLKC